MQKLIPVEEARALMTEAQNWSVWRWLTEKRRVRGVADRATEALAQANRRVKDSWSEELLKAYDELVQEEAFEVDHGSKAKWEAAREAAQGIDPKIKTAARKVKESDDEALDATMDAEDMFEEAERRMSSRMAKEAARKALESYDLREKAIRKAEAAGRN
jgi:hypothetical protein